MVQKVLSNLTVICVECGGLVKASAMEKHADVKCQTHTMPISPSSVTVQDILSKAPPSPLSPLEQKLGSNRVQRMETNGTLQVTTGGQVNIIVK